MNLILCGHKACGKTTLARAYANVYACDYIDTDELMLKASETGEQSIGDLYEALGEKQFRALESEVVKQIKPTQHTIIATGGGTVLNPENVSYLTSLGRLVYLKLKDATLLARLNALPIKSKLFSDKFEAHVLLDYFNSRDSIYQAIADDVIDVDDASLDRLVVMLARQVA